MDCLCTWNHTKKTRQFFNMTMNCSMVFAFFCLFVTVEPLSAQNHSDSLGKINKRRVYEMAVLHNNQINGDSIQGSMIEYRICACKQYLVQDSLLKNEMDSLYKVFTIGHDTAGLSRLEKSHDLWERYLFVHCQMCLSADQSSVDAIRFMECATKLTIERIYQLRELCTEK